MVGAISSAGNGRIPDIIGDMGLEVVHVSEADFARDIHASLRRVETGTEIVIERDDQPVAILRAAQPAHRTISECIALAEAHEAEFGLAPTLDADFASDVEEIVRNRQPWNPPEWD